MPDAPSLRRRLERTWHMARHVPPRQIVRRLSLTVRGHLERLALPDLDARPLPTPAPAPPRSLLPPRHDLLAGTGLEQRLALPWGSCPLVPAPDWHMPAPDEAAGLLRAALHNMEYLTAVDRAAAVDLMRSWAGANPFDRVDARLYAWRPFNLSIRVVAWMRVLAGGGGDPSPVLAADLHRALVRQIRYLVDRLETDLRGNHLVKNITALVWAGAFFVGPEARNWQEIGRRLLSEELAEQILDDGCHIERSPTYQCQVMADLLDCRAALDPGPLRLRVEEGLQRMALALRHLLHPDGEVALLNDGGLRASWPPSLVLAGWRASGGRDPDPPEGPFALACAGYWGLRRGGDYLIVDCGPLGPDYLVGHGHADILSLEWSTAGVRIVVDQGTYAYAAGPRRIASRSTRNHNTLTIGGAEQSDLYDAYRCGRRARPRLLDWAAEADGIRFAGTHDGFNHLPGCPRHERRLTAGPGRLAVHDRLLGYGRSAGEVGFLLHPCCRIVERDESRLLLAHGEVVVEVVASRPLVVAPAEWYPDMFTALATSRLVCSVPPGEPGVELRFRRRAPGVPAEERA